MTDSFNRIMQGLQEALEHARGADVPGLVLHVPERVDVAAVRRRKLERVARAPSR